MDRTKTHSSNQIFSKRILRLFRPSPLIVALRVRYLVVTHILMETLHDIVGRPTITCLALYSSVWRLMSTLNDFSQYLSMLLL